MLEIRNLRMPGSTTCIGRSRPPLVERYLRHVVDERVSVDGEVLKALDPADAEAAIDRLLAEGVEAIAVCLLNSFANPTHEQMLKEILARKAPDLPSCISFDVLPEIKEYERTSTTVINAYILPVVARYLNQLRADLNDVSITSPLLLMQSNGGLTTSEVAAPPAGQHHRERARRRRRRLPGLGREDGTFRRHHPRHGWHHGQGGADRGRRGHAQPGIPGRRRHHDGLPPADGRGLHTEEPGDRLGRGRRRRRLQVLDRRRRKPADRPESAGAEPGPVCYDIGGEDPTITDANLILGYINPGHLVGGAVKLNAEKARRVFQERVAEPMGWNWPGRHTART